MADYFMDKGGNAAELIQRLQGQSPLLWQLNLAAEPVCRGPDQLSVKPMIRAEFLDERKIRGSTLKQQLVTIVRFSSKKREWSKIYLGSSTGHISSLNPKYTTVKICPAYVWDAETYEPSIFVVHPEGYVQQEHTHFYEAAAFARFFGPIEVTPVSADL